MTLLFSIALHKKGTGYFFLIGGFDKSTPYTIYKKVACPLIVYLFNGFIYNTKEKSS